MSRTRPRRLLALLALALLVSAALPCSLLAGEGTCCGARARCADPGESPCAQPAPCCTAPHAPIAVSFSPALPPPALLASVAPVPSSPAGALAHDSRGAAPAALADHLAIRDVSLRL